LSTGMASERIDLFHEDCLKLVTGEGLNIKRIQSEIKKLRKWLMKHQDEVTPESSKMKLLSILQVYYQLYHDRKLIEAEYANDLEGLLDDYLKYPEGKLTTSKSKQTCLNWLTNVQRSVSNEVNGLGSEEQNLVKMKRFLVGDLNEDETLLLMSPDPNSEEYIENARILPELKEELLVHVRNTESNYTIYVNVQSPAAQSADGGDGFAMVVSYELSDVT
jgi:hypothetical protein